VLVAGQFLVERRLVRRREALAAVGTRHADPGEAGVEEPALHLPVVGDGGELLLPRDAPEPHRHLRGEGLEVRTHPGARPLPEALDVLDLVGAHAASSCCRKSVIRCRCCAGVPNSARSTLSRRRKRCRSCSYVSPIPPCSWKQSWRSSAP